MTAEPFEEVLGRKPFQPFRIVMSSGESCILSHPEMIFVTAMTLVLAVPEPTHPEGERIASCSYPQIAHVETYRPVRAA